MKRITLLFLLALGTIVPARAQGLTEKDSRFIQEAYQVGLLEIRLSELCVTHAASEEVKLLGQKIILEHTKTNSELRELAARKNVVLPEGLSKAGNDTYQDLQQKRGSSFDHAYADAMLADHKTAIALFKSENLEGSDPDVTTWAARTLPVLESHYVRASDAVASLK